MLNQKILRNIVLEMSPHAIGANPSTINSAIDEVGAGFIDILGPIRLPNAGESVAVGPLADTKVSALFFDRVWSHKGRDDAPPDDIRVFCGSEIEYFVPMMSSMVSQNNWTVDKIVRCAAGFGSREKKLLFTNDPGADLSRLISQAMFAACGVKSIPIYADATSMDREYRRGDTRALMTAIENVQVVDGSKLKWEQVINLRRDQNAKKKLRRLQHWLDKELVGKPISFVSHEIEERLDGYNWAIKKHGIQTVTGILSDLLDERFLAKAGGIFGSLFFSGLPGLAELIAGGLAIGKVAISVTNRLVDLEDRKRSQGSEVAFVNELKKLTK